MAGVVRGRRGMASLAWRMIHGAFDFEVSMKNAMPGVPVPEFVNLPAGAPTHVAMAASGGLNISSLPNGVRVVSCDVPGQHVSSLGLFLNAGSRYETPQTSGATFLLENFAFKGSTERSKVLMQREMEALGAHFGASAHREVLMYASEGMRRDTPHMMRILAEAATKPVFGNCYKGPGYVDQLVAEIKGLATAVEHNWKIIEKDANALMNESLHQAAFEGNSFGLPCFPTAEAVQKMSPFVIADYAASIAVGDRITVSGVNISHSELEQLASEYLGALPRSKETIVSTTKYTGGEKRVSLDGMVACAIGFEGVHYKDEDLIPACVLQTLLGGGGSFSSGGPGKGMYTKLYTDVLARNDWVVNTVSMNNIYMDSGLFGICASSEPGTLPQLIELVATECVNMAQKLDKTSIERAKSMTISSLRMNLESRGVMCEDMGRQVLASGVYESADKLAGLIKKVTAGDLERVASRMLKSKPSVSIAGDLYGTPSYFDIHSYIESKSLSA
ncbi:Mitochondrial-processing peptidase subunit alpha [Porphyridium purpureum]|uniref:Mitochondrial-processing peptidase subunit alpha n=1 Tax=Porphyridium purpureum TaxID=35688 RepID=A0A5J4Z490_PORPP|nr:Mitochondrial-processing peptidase subunit alpha [Porphyridium purpureum]|eukprot:POR4254..scf295_1